MIRTSALLAWGRVDEIESPIGHGIMRTTMAVIYCLVNVR